jgi:6-pyruvoyltetrahydropterin/6-carboxytetrahydropterin synthase
MFELLIKSDISSAHYLRGYQGKCKELHGHTWKIEVVISGEKLNKIGMVSDFTFLKQKLNQILCKLDHTCLNQTAYFKKYNPTAENIAKFIYDSFKKSVKPVKVKEVRIWESDNSCVIYYE